MIIYILKFRDRIPESTRRILGMLVPDPSVIVGDKKWRALSNRQIMRIIRVALQPDSESDCYILSSIRLNDSIKLENRSCSICNFTISEGCVIYLVVFDCNTAIYVYKVCDMQ